MFRTLWNGIIIYVYEIHEAHYYHVIPLKESGKRSVTARRRSRTSVPVVFIVTRHTHIFVQHEKGNPQTSPSLAIIEYSSVYPHNPVLPQLYMKFQRFRRLMPP